MPDWACFAAEPSGVTLRSSPCMHCRRRCLIQELGNLVSISIQQMQKVLISLHEAHSQQLLQKMRNRRVCLSARNRPVCWR